MSLSKVIREPDAQTQSGGLTREVKPFFMPENQEETTENITTMTPAKDAPALVKKIGRTTYIVRVHFSKTSKGKCWQLANMRWRK